MTDGNHWSVTVPFLQDGTADTPNSRSQDALKRLNDYFEAMFVTFASIRRFNPHLALTLISNTQLPEPYASLHRSIGVTTSIIPFTNRPQDNTEYPFTASLYYLDVLPQLKSTWNIVLDPDVLCVDTLSFMDKIPDGHLGGLIIDYPPEKLVNGLSRNQAQVLHERLGLNNSTPTYYGGEIYVIPGSLAQQVSKLAQRVWQFRCASNNIEGLKVYTEEHIMNYVFANMPTYSLQGSIKRIWTTHRHRTVTGSESATELWHLPAEKGRGFHELFMAATDENSWFWQQSRHQFVNKSSRAMGLRRRRTSRWIADQLGTVLNLMHCFGKRLHRY